MNPDDFWDWAQSLWTVFGGVKVQGGDSCCCPDDHPLTNHPLTDGWIPWNAQHPPEKLIQYWRPEWDEPVVGYPSEIHPLMNVYGLYWRMTGIGKEPQKET